MAPEKFTAVTKEGKVVEVTKKERESVPMTAKDIHDRISKIGSTAGPELIDRKLEESIRAKMPNVLTEKEQKEGKRATKPLDVVSTDWIQNLELPRDPNFRFTPEQAQVILAQAKQAVERQYQIVQPTKELYRKAAIARIPEMVTERLPAAQAAQEKTMKRPLAKDEIESLKEALAQNLKSGIEDDNGDFELNRSNDESIYTSLVLKAAKDRAQAFVNLAKTHPELLTKPEDLSDFAELEEEAA